MTTHALFIRDDEGFEKNKKQVEETMATKEGLPNQIFGRDFSWFAFEEFDWAMSDEFWTALQEMACVSGDSSVLMAVLDPDPKSYFKNEFGYYNWAEIPVSSSKDDYWNVLNAHPESSLADSILFNSEKVVWLPRSGKWAVWGERSYGVCVLGSYEHVENGPWRDVEWALANCFANNFTSRIVPAEFATLLRRNFGKK